MHENSNNERHENTVIIDLLVSAGEAGVAAAGSATEQHLVRTRSDTLRRSVLWTALAGTRDEDSSPSLCYIDSFVAAERVKEQPLVFCVALRVLEAGAS